jgi:hypothetical protein
MILTVGLCFGLGLGLARALPVAHASKCDVPTLKLELDAIEGDTDPTVEQNFWTSRAALTNADADDPTLHLTLDGPGALTQSLELEPR